MANGSAAPVTTGLAVGIGFVALFSMPIQRSFIPDTGPAIDLPKDAATSEPINKGSKAMELLLKQVTLG